MPQTTKPETSKALISLIIRLTVVSILISLLLIERRLQRQPRDQKFFRLSLGL